MDYGYVRVSTEEQNEDRQMIAMRKFGIKDKGIILDRWSGRDFGHCGYRRLMYKLKAGDPLVFKNITGWDEIIIKSWNNGGC